MRWSLTLNDGIGRYLRLLLQLMKLKIKLKIKLMEGGEGKVERVERE